MKKIFGLSVSILVLINFSQAQDIHFSQFYNSPLTLNAANTGHLDSSKIRAVANYRNQWANISAPYVTEAISVDYKITHKKLGRNYFGIGVLGIYDKSGTGELTNKSILASLAYHQNIGKKNTIRIGGQFGITSASVNVNKLVFANQYDPVTHTFKNVSTESFVNGNINYYNFHAGIVWQYKISKKLKSTLGANWHNINKPKESFLTFNSTSTQQPIGIFFNSWDIKINEHFSMLPNVYYAYTYIANEFVIGSSAAFGSTLKLLPGIYFRAGDALIYTLALQFKQIKFGFSYDQTISSLHIANNYNGAWELMLAYHPQ